MRKLNLNPFSHKFLLLKILMSKVFLLDGDEKWSSNMKELLFYLYGELRYRRLHMLPICEKVLSPYHKSCRWCPDDLSPYHKCCRLCPDELSPYHKCCRLCMKLQKFSKEFYSISLKLIHFTSEKYFWSFLKHCQQLISTFFK